jgi:hypothetical protein
MEYLNGMDDPQEQHPANEQETCRGYQGKHKSGEIP